MTDLHPALAPLASPRADDRYDEAVSQREHALQCAALAVEAGADDALVVAALLHDIGHLSEPDHAGLREVDHRHEDLGARLLRRWFGPEVTAPVALHVAAKRYLCGADDAYASILSPGSVHSMELQGGPMSTAERETFAARPGWEGAVVLRRWDDLAKVPGAVVPDLDVYEDRVARLV